MGDLPSLSGYSLSNNSNQPLAIVYIGRCYHHRQQQPQSIDQGMTLATFDFLVAVKADILMLGRHLDRLTIGTTCRGIVFVPLTTALPGAKRVHEVGPHALLAPATKIPVDGHALAEVMRHHAPLTAGLIDIENAIENPPEVERWTSGSTGLPLGFR